MAAGDQVPADPDGTGAGPPPRPSPAPASGRPAHSVRPVTHPSRMAAVIGSIAALAAVGLGTAALLRAPRPTPGASHTLRPITVSSPPAAVLPLSGAEILALLDRAPDFGPLADAPRRASCLTGLGYSASTPVLGARPVEINGASGVLLVLPGDQTGTVVALAVAPNCSSADTGLLADTVVRLP